MTAATAAPSHAAPQLSTGTRLAYGFGSVAYGIKESGFSTLLLLFYNQVVGLPAGQVGLAIMLALVIDAFVDPVIGHFSDHLRSRWGRRHPFMYAAALPVGLLYLLLWNPPQGASHFATLAYLVAVAVTVRSAISCYEVPSSALAPELTADYHERTAVLSLRYLFSWSGGMVMLLLAFAVFLAPTAKYPHGQLNPDGYKHYAVTASIVMTTAIVLSALGTHNRIKFLPKPQGVRPPVRRTFHAIFATLKNRAFLTLLMAGVFIFTSQGLTFSLAAYFNSYVWLFPQSIFVTYTFSVLGGVAVAVVLARMLSRRMDKLKAALLCLSIYPAIVCAPLIGRAMGLMPGNGTPLLFPVLMLLTTMAVAFSVTVTILAASMMADVVEDAQSRTGERREGLFFAGSFFMQKCVTGIGLFLSGAILSAVGFPDKAEPGRVAIPVLNHLIVIYCAMVVVLATCGFLVLRRFPLGGRAEHDRRLSEIAAAGMILPGSEGEFVPMGIDAGRT
jgi:GPH family glycoside/pentoside/hexuronide:cation symporter